MDMLTDVFGDNSMAKVLDYLLDFPYEGKKTFTQKEVRNKADVSLPTAVKVFKILVRDGMLKKVKGGYKLLYGRDSPMKALMDFDFRACSYAIKENRK